LPGRLRQLYRTAGSIVEDAGPRAQRAYEAARNAVSRTFDRLVGDTNQLGLQMSAGERADLANRIGQHSTTGTTPFIEDLQDRLLHNPNPMYYSDLENAHTHVVERLPQEQRVTGRYVPSQNLGLANDLRDAQGRLLQSHPDLHRDFMSAREAWRTEVVPSRKLLKSYMQEGTTIDTPAMGKRFARQVEGERGVPEVNRTLEEVQRILQAQRRPLTSMPGLVAGGAVGHMSHVTGNPLLDTALGAGAESLLRQLAIGFATPEGRAAAMRLIPLAGRAANQMTPANPAAINAAFGGGG